MIEINNESGVNVDEVRLRELGEFVLEELNIHPQAELSILLVDLDTMSAYHEKFLDLPGPTDVLSFPMDELRIPGPGEAPPEGLLGDVVLAPEYVAKQAPTKGNTAAEEADYLLVHGILHLLGFDHAEPEDERVMFALNDRLIADWKAKRAGEAR
ncbi:MAG: rRNA maturation RNase YbeY [Propionibacteriaceae bacterium]|jgi:probable rRNA maturation factor|nr:rRNA maturation RNase YbeY [Propionibacteriaceae bacterium]